MKIRIRLIGALLSISGLCSAQIKEADFNKAVDYVNCKAIEHSLNTSPTKGVISEFEGKCKCESNPDFQIIKSAIRQSEDKTISLSDEIELIKKEYKTNLTKELVIKLLTETIFNNKPVYNKIFDFAKDPKRLPQFEKLKLELKKNLATRFHKVESKITIDSTIGKEEVDPNPNQKVDKSQNDLGEKVKILEDDINILKEKNNSMKDVFTFIINILSIIFSLIILFYLLKKISSSEAVVTNKIKDYIKEYISKNNSNNASGPSSLEMRVLKDDIERLKKEIRQLNSKSMSEIDQVIRDQKPFQEIKPLEKIPQTETFFLSTPNSDGSFNESSASNLFKDGASIYKFTKIDEKRAKFQIDEREASVKLALQYPDKSIDPVCEAMNAFNPKAKRILTASQGEAELVNGKWIKNIKAKIRYEY